MIEVKLFKNSNNDIFSFTVLNHADSFVCAGVSMLVINTVNAIEAFTEAKFTIDYDEIDGGYMKVILPEIKSGKHFNDVALLLNTLELGLDSTLQEYPDEIIINKEVQQ